MRDASPEALAAYRKLSAHWVDPSTPSVVSQADAFSKQAAVVPGLAETEVGLELSGMTRDQITRYMDERRRARGAALVGALDTAQSAAEQAAAVKAKVDVFTALLAAGVARDSAAAQAGLAGLQWADSGPAASAAPAAPGGRLR
jgi:hypothetical protein